LIDKLISVAQPGSVFGQPVTAGDYTLLTASEVTAGAGIGFAVGAGSNGPTADQATTASGTGEAGAGSGGGGGGGGGSLARPVAAITIGPDGVMVEPIVDVTKIAIALFTTIASMAFMLSRARRWR
jgi:uncharacterized spore protein YtfJ